MAKIENKGTEPHEEKMRMITASTLVGKIIAADSAINRYTSIRREDIERERFGRHIWNPQLHPNDPDRIIMKDPIVSVATRSYKTRPFREGVYLSLEVSDTDPVSGETNRTYMCPVIDHEEGTAVVVELAEWQMFDMHEKLGFALPPKVQERLDASKASV